jgi:hypothetical protein
MHVLSISSKITPDRTHPPLTLLVELFFCMHCE